VDITRKPIEEQLAQVLETIASIEPDTIDLSNLSFEFLITYTFMATNIPISIEVIFVKTEREINDANAVAKNIAEDIVAIVGILIFFIVILFNILFCILSFLFD
jgi:hypothetical protein